MMTGPLAQADFADNKSEIGEWVTSVEGAGD